MQANVNNGVVQQLSRVNPFVMQSYSRKVLSPLKKEGKNPKPRQIHPSQRGLVCCIETPEGAPCGLILVMCLFAKISTGIRTPVAKVMLENSVGQDSPCPLVDDKNMDSRNVAEEDTIVLINGSVWGTTQRPEQLEHVLISMRLNRDLPWEMRFVWNRAGPLARYFYINTDCSTALRPLLRVDRIQTIAAALQDASIPEAMIWRRLDSMRCVEWFDKEEEEARNIVVADIAHKLHSGKYTHIEMDPTSILGVLASLIPYSCMNQSPRNMYFTSMVKQSLALPCLAYRDRVDKDQFVTWYPQEPLSSTRFHQYMIKQSGGITCAQCPIFAVGCWSGHNMEDSILVKKEYVDRGGFMTTYIRGYFSDARKKGAEKETHQRPPKDCIGRKGRADYSKLDESGVVPVGTTVYAGDVLIGKVAHLQDDFDAGPIHDRSLVLSKIESGVVDAVIRATRANGQELIWVKVRITRRPKRGDKFASFAAQKGTVGMVVPQVDLPFNPVTGISPDVIMNSHAIPSRMTIGMLVECLTSKAAALSGEKYVADSFQGVSLQDTCDTLIQHGFSPMGKEMMLDGTTGRQMEARFFMGPVTYQRLKHMADDKLHARSIGPRAILTRQPTEGRSREGGIRFGEMEGDALKAHGVASAMRDRLCDCSDATPVPLCRKCGQFAEHAHSDRFGKGVHSDAPFCRGCGTGEHVVIITMPFAAVLLFYELQGLHITLRIKVE